MYTSKKSPRRYGGAPGNSRGPSRGFNEERELFSATCNKCHMACEVPFRPNGKKPVYCRNCFVRDDAQGASSYQSREQRDSSFSRPPSFSRAPAGSDNGLAALAKEVSIIHAKLDDIIARLEA